MASIKVPQESTVTGSFEQRSPLDLRQAEFPVHLRQKSALSMARVFVPSGDYMGRTTEQQGIKVRIAELARIQAVGRAVGGCECQKGCLLK
jgi:hypothetical protein